MSTGPIGVAHDPGLHLAILFFGGCSGFIVGVIFTLIVRAVLG